MRPHIKVELHYSPLLDDWKALTVQSFVSEFLGQRPEVESINCISLQNAVAEKIIALIRRTSDLVDGLEGPDDEALVRHAYDLHILRAHLGEAEMLSRLIPILAQRDIDDYNVKDSTFSKNPGAAYEIVIQELKGSPLFRERYEKFLGPLVYAKPHPDWDDAIESVDFLARLAWA